MNKRDYKIAFLVHDFYSEIANNMWQGINDSLLQNNCSLISIMGGRLNETDEKLKAQSLIYGKITPDNFDGFIFWAPNIFLYLSENEIHSFLEKFKKKPVVILQKKIEGYTSIIHNLSSGITNILDHLTNVHNYKKIGFVRGPENHHLSKARYDTYIDYLKNHNIPIDDKIISPWENWSEKTGISYIYHIIDKYKLKIGKDIEAIVCSNTNIAKGIIKELKKRGYSLPRDIAITGYNDDKEADVISPSITLADPDFYQMGQIAVENIIKLIEKEKVPDEIIFDSKLIIRNSCGCIEDKISNLFKEENKPLEIETDNDKDNLKNIITKSIVHSISQPLLEKLYTLFYHISSEMRNSSFFDTNFHFFVKDVMDSLYQEKITLEEQESLFYNFFLYQSTKLKETKSLTGLYKIIYYIFTLSNLYQLNILEYNHLINERTNLEFNSIGVQLITNHGLSNLVNILIDNFEKLKSDYVSLFINEKKNSNKLTLYLSINSNSQPKKGKIVDSTEIFNKEFLPEKEPFSIVVLPLTYLDEFLGVLMLKTELVKPDFYIQLQAQLNSAIKSTFLLKEREKLTNDIKIKNRRLNSALKSIYGEMELTKKIQTNILPKNYQIKGYDIFAFMKPAKDIGGDYYDIINLEDNNYWITIGDVSGHGIDAGMIMLMLQTSVMTQLLNNKNITPAKLTTEANRLIHYNCRNRLEKESYITTCFMKFNDNGEFTYAGAHLEILIYRKKSNSVEVLETTGFWLGILPEISNFITEKKFTLEKDDVMLVFTDGVIEAFDKNRNLYTLERLIDFLKNNGNENSETIAKKLIDSIEKFQHTQIDDYTFIIAKKI